MIIFLKKITALTVLLAVLIFSAKPFGVVEAYSNLYSFSTATGAGPHDSLVYVDADGLFYGGTTVGGTFGAGVLFSYNPDTLTYTVLYELNGVADGSGIEGPLTYIEGTLYGLAVSAGGVAGDKSGTLFSYDIDKDTFTVLHTFGEGGTDANTPVGSLIYVSGDGALYGMTNKGGVADDGVIFSYVIDTATYTDLFEFDRGTTGEGPIGSLLYDDGVFFGTTPTGGANDQGVVFRFVPADGTPYTVLHSFSELEQSATHPVGALVLDDDGTLYGVTNGNEVAGQAGIFSIESTGADYQVLHNFDDGDGGALPYGSLLYTGFGKLYGMTSGGGTNGVGTIFLYDALTDTYTVEHDFDGANGSAPRGSLVLLNETRMYGTADLGGTNDVGVIFSHEGPDVTPDEISFPHIEDVEVNTRFESEQVNITGLSTTVPVVITDCTSVLCEVDKSIVSDGDKFGVSVTSGICNTSVSVTVQIGTVSATFTVSTQSCGGGGGGLDIEAPTVSFTMPSTGSSLTVPIELSALDNIGVTGYILLENPATPEISDEGWEETAPTSYTFSTYNTHTLYVWAKDAAGNRSVESSQTITLTSPPEPDPDPEPDPEEESNGGGGGGSSSGSSVAGAGLVGVQPSTPSVPQTVVPVVVPVAPVVVDTPRPPSEPAIVLDSPIKQAIKRNFTPAQVEIIEVSLKAIIATVTAIGGAIVLASVLFLNPLARPEFILIPLRLWALLLTALGIRKKPVPWGTVYDAITKQPVDPVRVSLIDTEGKVVETSITDSSGRYGFAAKPGIYKVVLSKTNYLFPSHVIAQENDMRDELYEKPYFGDYLPYDPQVPIIKNIPIDPIDFDTAAFAKKNGDLSFRYSKREVVAERLFNTIFFTTFAIVVASLAIYPEKYSAAVFVLYVAAFILRRHNKRMKHTGRIYDMYGKPLAHVVIKIYSAVDGTLVKTIKTNRSGRYYAHLTKGLYTIRVERKTSDGLYVPVYSSPELLVQHGILNKVFNIAYS